MSQWNKILKVLDKLDFSDFTRINLPGQSEEDPRCDACVVLSPKWLASEGQLESWHIFGAIYQEETLSFRLPADSLCGRCQPTTRLVGGNEENISASLYLEDARIFFAVLQNQGASICGQCLSFIYSDSRDNSDLKISSVKMVMKNLKL